MIVPAVCTCTKFSVAPLITEVSNATLGGKLKLAILERSEQPALICPFARLVMFYLLRCNSANVSSIAAFKLVNVLSGSPLAHC